MFPVSQPEAPRARGRNESVEMFPPISPVGSTRAREKRILKVGEFSNFGRLHAREGETHSQSWRILQLWSAPRARGRNLASQIPTRRSALKYFESSGADDAKPSASRRRKHDIPSVAASIGDGVSDYKCKSKCFSRVG